MWRRGAYLGSWRDIKIRMEGHMAERQSRCFSQYGGHWGVFDITVVSKCDYYSPHIQNKFSDRSMEVYLSALLGNYDRPTDDEPTDEQTGYKEVTIPILCKII